MTRDQLREALLRFKTEGGFVYASQEKDADALLDALERYTRDIARDVVSKALEARGLLRG